MPTTTSKYSLYKPLVNDPTDADQWGTQLNTNMDTIDTQLYKSAGSPTVAKTANYTTVVLDNGQTILCDATAAGFTVTLLAAATAGNGYMVTIKKTDSTTNTITVDGNASETIDGSLTYTISAQYDTVTLVSNGANWFKLNYTQNAGLTSRTYYVTGSGNFTVPSGVTRVRTYISGGGGGGHGGDGNSSVRAGSGGDSTVTYSATTVTGGGGLGGIWSITNINAPVLSTATNGDINISGGGSSGGNSGTNGNNAVTRGQNGAMAIKDWTVTPGSTMAYVVGAAGAKLDASVVTATDGATGYIIFEY